MSRLDAFIDTVQKYVEARRMFAASCFGCGKEPAPQRCGRCRYAVYCGAACARDNWPAHKEHCNRMTDCRKRVGDKLVDENLRVTLHMARVLQVPMCGAMLATVMASLARCKSVGEAPVDRKTVLIEYRGNGVPKNDDGRELTRCLLMVLTATCHYEGGAPYEVSGFVVTLGDRQKRPNDYDEKWMLANVTTALGGITAGRTDTAVALARPCTQDMIYMCAVLAPSQLFGLRITSLSRWYWNILRRVADPAFREPHTVPTICGGCLVSSTTKKRACNGCRTLRYCNRACQQSHWPAHKAECESVQRAIGPDPGEEALRRMKLNRRCVRRLMKLMQLPEARELAAMVLCSLRGSADIDSITTTAILHIHYRPSSSSPLPDRKTFAVSAVSAMLAVAAECSPSEKCVVSGDFRMAIDSVERVPESVRARLAGHLVVMLGSCIDDQVAHSSRFVWDAGTFGPELRHILSA